MKKFLIFCMAALLLTGMAASLFSCEQKKDAPPDIGYVPLGTSDGALNVENTISTNREYMFLHYGKDYRWYESCILLKDYIDAVTGSVSGLNPAFNGSPFALPLGEWL